MGPVVVFVLRVSAAAWIVAGAVAQTLSTTYGPVHGTTVDGVAVWHSVGGGHFTQQDTTYLNTLGCVSARCSCAGVAVTHLNVTLRLGALCSGAGGSVALLAGSAPYTMASGLERQQYRAHVHAN